ncbi:putative ribonuclease VapC2 [Nitrospira moscoviensis]|uniref:Ribonuclease VapC n=2 Tax=Nitrospira moscoviensis TaxID=42253 RepID=A0A0K2G949_NITMO|nr:putative ribonuclease VapC2 [Nitrospira moscoviensis]
MKLMLDTNICIYLIKKHPVSVLDRFRSFQVGTIGISIITLAELLYGVAKSRDPARNREALSEFTAPLEVAPFDTDAAAEYGRVRTVLEKQGRLIGAMDLLIAAHAVSLDVTLITNNIAEFKRVPRLNVENWL